MKITTCDICDEKVPSCFVKKTEDGATVCHPCYSGARKDRGQVDDFFEGVAPHQLEKLRRAIPKFPETSKRMPIDHPDWAGVFAGYATRKATWYGFADAFEFFGECLKEEI